MKLPVHARPPAAQPRGRRAAHLDIAQKRGLTLAEAANYAGVSRSAFRDWVLKGRVPGPWPGTHRYDRRALDTALDRISGLQAATLSPYDDWKVKRAAAHTA
jgi:excisionase family DNA binding protein